MRPRARRRRPSRRPGPEPNPPGPPGAGAISLAFTEEMKGFVSFDEEDFDRGYRAGREQRTALMFHLTITADDLDRFIATPEHQARAEGYVRSDALGAASWRSSAGSSTCSSTRTATSAASGCSIGSSSPTPQGTR